MQHSKHHVMRDELADAIKFSADNRNGFCKNIIGTISNASSQDAQYFEKIGLVPNNENFPYYWISFVL